MWLRSIRKRKAKGQPEDPVLTPLAATAFPKYVGQQPVEKVAVGGCSKSSRCKAGKIPKNEAYFQYVE
jgi:hypothetical protein